jgi:enoyl-CoA hydratase
VSTPLTYTLEDKVATVRMDDGKANALSYAMIDGLLESLERAEKEASAMILTGRPDRFCAGFDLKVMMSSPADAKKLLTRGVDLFMKLYASKVPLIAAATGHALAGGALVLLCCDLRIGAEGAYRIGLNEVQIGLPVPVLAMELARDRLEETELTKATLLATIYDPPGAKRAGYLDETVAHDALMPRAKELATQLSSLARAPFEATKQRLRQKTIDHIYASLESDMASLLPS